MFCHVINVNARIKITSHVDVRYVLKCVLLDQARHCVYFALYSFVRPAVWQFETEDDLNEKISLTVNYRLHFVLKGSHSLDDPSCTLIHFSQVCVRSCNQITRFGIMSAPICFLWPQNCPVCTLCNSWVQSGCVVATAAPEPTLGQQTYQASVRALRWSWNWEANRSCDRHTAAVAGV